MTREKESQQKEAARTKELWDTERNFLLQRFNGILQSQRHNMQHLQESVAASMQYMDKLGEDFMGQTGEAE